MKIGIGFAAYISNDLHLDYARQTIESLHSAEHELALEFCVNYVSRIEYWDYLESQGKVIENEENIVSRAWNRVIEDLLIDGCRYVIVPNLDLVLKSNAIDNLVAHAERNPGPIVWTATQWGDRDIEAATEEDTVIPHPHFSMFMVDHRLLAEVGGFDENFVGAYNEDLDMHWRIRLAGHEAVAYNGSRFFHYGSRTILADPLLAERNHVTHTKNNNYFNEKWGYKPPTANDPFTDGMYRFPFNDPERAFVPSRKE